MTEMYLHAKKMEFQNQENWVSFDIFYDMETISKLLITDEEKYQTHEPAKKMDW